jgi:hypothetical protein
MTSERPQLDRAKLSGILNSSLPWMWAIGLVLVGIVLARIIQAALSGAAPVPESQLELHVVRFDSESKGPELKGAPGKI